MFLSRKRSLVATHRRRVNAPFHGETHTLCSFEWRVHREMHSARSDRVVCSELQRFLFTTGAIDSSYRLIQALISSISFFLFLFSLFFFHSRSFAEQPPFEKRNIFDPRGKSLATSFILKLPDKVSLILFSVHSTVFSRRRWFVSLGQVSDFSLFVIRNDPLQFFF